MSRRQLVGVQVVPLYVEVDDDGRIVTAPQTPTVQTPQGVQQVVFTLSPREWEDGWDWEQAVAQLEAQQTNGQPPTLETPPPANRADRRATKRRKT